jgi:hypothetical protein
MSTPAAPDAASHEPSQGTEVHDVSDHGVSEHDVLRAAVMTAAWTTYEVLLAPEDITWARSQAYPLHIISYPDGRILVTAAHAPTCPLITSNGRSPCDRACDH